MLETQMSTVVFLVTGGHIALGWWWRRQGNIAAITGNWERITASTKGEDRHQ